MTIPIGILLFGIPSIIERPIIVLLRGTSIDLYCLVVVKETDNTTTIYIIKVMRPLIYTGDKLTNRGGRDTNSIRYFLCRIARF